MSTADPDDQQRVRVHKEKSPLAGSEAPRPVSSWDARLLGADQFGTWLSCAQGELHRRSVGSRLGRS